jgi:amidohydrolase
MSNNSSVIMRARALQNELIKTRRYLHAHPELSFEEHKTAEFACTQLEKLGYKVKTHVGKTGLIADAPDKNLPSIAIRADMDALPLEETPNNDYCSDNHGVMHACGHDAHIACALGAAQLIAQLGAESNNQLLGNTRILMQPSEEASDSQGRSGAYRMIEDNAIEGMSAIIGLHMDASLPAGTVGIAAGPVMAAADPFEITIIGKGGHGAFPEETIDSVVLSAQVIQAIQQIISRRVTALEPAIITIGSIRSSSTAGNIISDRVILKGVFRTFDKKMRANILDELEKACSIVQLFGGSYKIAYDHGYPATVNDPQITEIMRQVAIDLIGEQNVIAIKPKPWSEDFSMFAEKIPGAFMFLGGEIAGDRRYHHTTNFDIDESGLHIGSAVLAETAIRLSQYFKDKK